MNKVLKYHIKLSIKTLKDIFSYFDMNENNTIIELVSRNNNILETLSDYKNNIVSVKDNNGVKSVFLKKLNFSKLYYYLSKNTIFNIYYYKVSLKNNNVNNIKENSDVIIHVSLDKIKMISFDDNKFDYDKTKKELKKYRSINIELLFIILILIIGLIIRFGR